MKTPLTERMTKGGAAKTWIAEVEAKDREIERLEETKEEYLNTIDLLAQENEALSNLLSHLVDVELERDIAMSENQRLTKHVEDYEEENAALKRAVQAAIDYFTDGITSKEQYDAYLRFVDAAQPFFVVAMAAEEQDDAT